MISNVRNRLTNLCSLLLLATLLFCVVENVQASTEIVTVTSVHVGEQRVVFKTDAKQLVFKSYTLGAPSRLVVDVENVLPDFTERSFAINDGFKDLRIGLYADKTRFVFDALNDVLPDTHVEQKDGSLIISWGNKTEPVETIESGSPNSVKSIDFDAINGISVFKVAFSSPAQLISPTVDGDIIRFGVKDAVIPRSLRRVVDASVFPSAVLQITPYSTIVAGERRVMFAARMKGPVEYSVNLVDSSLVFRTVDGPFAEIAAKKVSSIVIPVGVTEPPSSMDNIDSVDQVIESFNSSSQTDEVESAVSFGAPVKVYTGEPVTLEFDDADIRTVMTLVAEVSGKNIILSDGVQGNLTLRLNDVPWDQALDLILEIKELGIVEQGNVVRVLPLKQIEAMETARLQAKQTIKRLEETVTQIFEVNYKDVDTIADVVEDMLSDQGEVSTIDGSKKLMITDIPSKLVEVGDLLVLLDEPVKQVMIEARIVEASTGNGLNMGISWGLNYSNDANVGKSIGSSQLDNGSVGLGGNYILSPTAGIGGLGSAFTFGRVGLDSLTLDLRLSALESSDQLKIVSSPKVLTLDGESAEISDGVQIPYKSVSEAGTTTQFQDATLSLKVTPEVNPDDTVILEIEVSNSRPGTDYSDGTGIDKKEAKTHLMLLNGETTVIGGVYVDSVSGNDEGVPLLKDIPYLGQLFKSERNRTDRREMLIFITPHIVK